MILKQWMEEWIISNKVKEEAEGLANSRDKTDIRSIMVLPVDLLSCKGVEGATHPSVGWIGLEDRCAVHIHSLHDLECHHHPPRRSSPFQGEKHSHHYRCASSQVKIMIFASILDNKLCSVLKPSICSA